MKRYTPEQRAWIADKCQNTTLPYKEIALLFNKKYKREITDNAVGKIRAKTNASKRVDNTLYTNEQKKWLIKTHKTGISRQEIVILFNEKFGHKKKINVRSKIFTIVEPKTRKRKINKLQNKTNKKIERDEQKILAIYLEPKTPPTYKEVANIYNRTAKVKISISIAKYTIEQHAVIRPETSIKKKPFPKYRMRKNMYGTWLIKEKEGERETRVHHLIYEYMVEKLKEDEMIIFKDGNKNNFALDNLIKINRQIAGSLAGNSQLHKFGKGSITKAWVEIKKLEYEIAEMIK